MPKMKTNRGAAKRFRKTVSQSFRRKHANANHILTKKSTKRKRRLRTTVAVADSDRASLIRLLPNG